MNAQIFPVNLDILCLPESVTKKYFETIALLETVPELWLSRVTFGESNRVEQEIP